jgi:hypothetical protein
MLERTFGSIFVMILGLCLGLGAGASAQNQNSLSVVHAGDKLSFEVVDEGGKNPWVLQYSADGQVWQDVIFLDRTDGQTKLTGEIEVTGMTGVQMESAFFRAVKLSEDDAFYREFLAARVRWTILGPSNYTYEVNWNWSFFTWNGRVTVVDGMVTATETISSFPEGIGPLDELTIEGLFQKIGNARDRGAERIVVDWDPELGFPASGFIDISVLIADEEQSWTIRKIVPLE